MAKSKIKKTKKPSLNVLLYIESRTVGENFLLYVKNVKEERWYSILIEPGHEKLDFESFWERSYTWELRDFIGYLVVDQHYDSKIADLGLDELEEHGLYDEIKQHYHEWIEKTKDEGIKLSVIPFEGEPPKNSVKQI